MVTQTDISHSFILENKFRKNHFSGSFTTENCSIIVLLIVSILCGNHKDCVRESAILFSQYDCA